MLQSQFYSFIKPKEKFCQKIQSLNPFCRGFIPKHWRQTLDPDLVEKIEVISFNQRKILVLSSSENELFLTKAQKKAVNKAMNLSDTFLQLLTKVEAGEESSGFFLMANYTLKEQELVLSFKQERSLGLFLQKLRKAFRT